VRDGAAERRLLLRAHGVDVDELKIAGDVREAIDHVLAHQVPLRDADFLAEAQKLNFDVRPVSATAIDAMLAEVYQTPKDVIARATKAISSEGQ